MKADWFGWPIVCAVVLGLLFCGAGQTWATTITIVDFEDLLVPSGTRLTPEPGIGVLVLSGEFKYTPGPLSGSSGFNDLHISNKFLGDSFNGTTVGISHDDVILTKVSGETFSLQRFDFAGFPKDAEEPFKVTGVRDGFPNVEAFFTPDGLVDSMGGVVDFQTFYLDGDWANLKSVTWEHIGYEYGTDRGLFALDNMYVDQPKAIPESSTITLSGLGILGLLGHGWLARKRLKALGEIA